MKCSVSVVIAVIVPTAVFAALSPPSHPLFEEDAVHEIHLTFHQADWWDQLVDNFEGHDDPIYLAAEFDWEGVHFDSIGVRFKGNSSYMGYPGVKKSFKLDIDEYLSDQNIDGLDKLNLNNGFLDPSFVRERCAYELCEAVGLATVRTNYAALYINGDYWGLYTLVEQFDQQFIEGRFGAGEEGNLWKGDPNGTLEYLGANESAYYNSYELETNEVENDWSALVEFVDRLNNTPIGDLVDSLHTQIDATTALAMLAIDNFTVNLDSYVGRCVNYYFYHRDLDGRLAFAKWDMNEAWGVFNMWNMPLTQLKQLDPFWVNPRPGEDRPLAERLFQVSAYEDIYLGHMKRLMAGVAQPDTLVARMETLRDLVRPYVYADNNKMFSNAQFDAAMSTNIYDGPRLIPALEPFIRDRDSWLRSQIGEWTPIEGLVVNELMADNVSTIDDELGDFDDWIEIANVGGSPVDLTGLSLADHFDGTTMFTFPSMSLDPGEYVLVWADEEPLEGDLHAPFKLDSDGEDVYLVDGTVIIDHVTFPALGTDLSWGRWPNGTGPWQLLSVATPGAENQNPEEPEVVVLVINEFLALNNGTNQDEMGQFEDWVEIYNPGVETVEMGGLFLTDDLAQTTQWMFPDTTIEASGFLLVWCDNDETDGPLHTNFKLSGDGEEIGLFGRLAAGNNTIDSYAFGAQTADISEGRLPDGDDNWVFFEVPTPGDSNTTTAIDDEDTGSPAGATPLALLPNRPNPFKPQTTIAFTSPNRGLVRVSVFDVAGRWVATLTDTEYDAGSHSVIWDGRSERGLRVPSGVYVIRMESDAGARSMKVILAR